MAASRRKQDEKNIKTLRELGVLLGNKYCFDCNQRGPTYVNVTIGSFVCTKCSGMLRGITPPHRVKSISMATFTNEEIDLLKTRGNDYCRQVWLGLYEGTPPISSGDETSIREFMVEKYERRRYYLDPVNVKPTQEPKAPKTNGTQVQPKLKQRSEISRNNSVDNNNLINNINNNNNSSNMNGFIADFDKADIFMGGSTTTLNGSASSLNGSATRLQSPENSFANFDNNPVFNNVNILANSTTDLQSSPFNYINSSWNQPAPVAPLNNSLNSTTSVPSEDRYAALKDLDNEFKSQKNGSLDWSTSSNGSSIATGSVNSSPSPQPSVFGSHNPGQFMGTFPLQQENNMSNLVSNPFNNNDLSNDINWPNLNPPLQQKIVNPFRDIMKTNGYMQDFHPVGAFPPQAVPFAVNGTNGWTQNPFKVGGTNGMNSNNPFL